jgi:hypothetical protein
MSIMTQQTPSNSIKANFYGLALYGTHLVMIKAKKTNLYEPKHWLPLRLFDTQKVPDGEGQLPYAIKMSYRNYSFEIGSLCHQEQDIWADSKPNDLTVAKFTLRHNVLQPSNKRRLPAARSGQMRFLWILQSQPS